jgi:glycosyltransferase involved in cell wall biosynthesis
MAREFVSIGHEVDFLTVATPGRETDEELDGIRIFRVRCHRRSVHHAGFLGALGFVFSAAPRLRALAKQYRYDAYHYYFGLPTGLLTQVPGEHRSKPYIVSLRGSDVPGYDRQLSVLHRLMLPITRRIWGGAHRVIANSDDLRKLAQAVMPGLRVDVVPNGATSSALSQGPNESDSGLRILTVSRLIGRKGVDTLIRALAKSNDPRLSLDVAGAGPKQAALRRLADSYGLAERVRFHGYADRTVLAALYARASVFVLMSRAESCSMALLEAMAANLPVIASKVGGNVELVQHDVNGLLVEADDVDGLARSLVRLADDPPLRARLVAATRSLIESKLGWSVAARAYEAILKQAVIGPAASPTAPHLSGAAQ